MFATPVITTVTTVIVITATITATTESAIAIQIISLNLLNYPNFLVLKYS